MSVAPFPDRPRFDAADKVRGATEYAADVAMPGMLYAMTVPATVALGRMTVLATDAAMAIPGVVRVLTPDDFPASPEPSGADGPPPPPATLVTEDLKPGTGAVVAAGAKLTVNYVGVACSTGKVFDSSYKRGKPAELPLSNVIPGWQQGIPGMKVGGQRLLGIPPAQGYGERGSGSGIGPQETLWFVVEVLDAKPAA